MSSTDPDGASPVLHRALRLAEVQPRRRFAQWQEWMAGVIDVLPPSEWPRNPYDGRLDLHAVGDVTFSRCRSDAVRLRRTLARISREGQGGYVFQLFLAGDPGVVRTRRGERVVRRGEMLALDLEQAVEMERPAYEALGIFVPRERIGPRLRGADIHASVVDTRRGLGALASAWVGQYLRELRGLAAGDAVQAMDTLLPLLCDCHASAVGRPHAAGADPHDLLARLLAFVHAHRSDPDLTPEALRRHFGLSRRQLYAAFASCEEGPATLIRRSRLAAARDQLVQQPAHPIAQVAYASGFSSLSDFGRAFRREYGMTPSELRAAAGRDGAQRAAATSSGPYARYLRGDRRRA